MSATPEENTNPLAITFVSTVAVKPLPGNRYVPVPDAKSGSMPPSQFAAVEKRPSPAPVHTYVASSPPEGGRTTTTAGPASPSSALTSPDASDE